MIHWKRNLAVICAAQLLTLVGFSSYLPFTPYYMQELGATSYADATRWQAIFEAGSATAMMIAAPIWGAIADRHGRKLMLVRATLAGSLLAFLMSLAQNPMQLVVIRTLQGAFCGTVSASMTMIATQTPEEHLSFGLGLMQTVQYAAFALGPLVGGVLADALGYRAVFPISATLMGAALLGITLFVHEKFERPTPSGGLDGERRWISGPFRLRLPTTWGAALGAGTVALLVTLGAMRLGDALVAPVISLYVKSLAPDHPRLATLAGSVTSVSAFSTALAAVSISRLADRVGQKRVLVVSMSGLALLFVPQAFVRTPTQLLLIRALQGVFMGGTMPTTNALLARTTAIERRGTIFGLSTSLQAAGRAIGPPIGAGIANGFGMGKVFLATGGLYALLTALVGLGVQLPSMTPVSGKTLAEPD